MKIGTVICLPFNTTVTAQDHVMCELDYEGRLGLDPNGKCLIDSHCSYLTQQNFRPVDKVKDDHVYVSVAMKTKQYIFVYLFKCVFFLKGKKLI